MVLVAEKQTAAFSEISALYEREAVHFFSSMTSKRVPFASELGSTYWLSNLLSQVNFADSLR